MAHVLASKYAWHLPLYRQAQMLKSQGIVVERMTLASWVGYAAAELAPVVARLREILLGSVKLAVDETPMPVLDPGRGRTKIGYFWSMARDDRPWGNDDPPAVAYTYRLVGARSMPSSCSRAIVASCSATAMRLTSNWLMAGAAAAPRHSPSAGRIGEGASMRSRKRGQPDRAGSAHAHCCALCDREADPRPQRCGTRGGASSRE